MIYALKALFEFPDLRELRESSQDTLHNQDTDHDRFM
jgi:hypothetical protein